MTAPERGGVTERSFVRRLAAEVARRARLLAAEYVRAAQTDADRQKLFQTLYAGIVLWVFDLQQKKVIDDKEFVKNNFVK